MNAIDKIAELHRIDEIPLGHWSFGEGVDRGVQHRCRECFYVLKPGEDACPTHRLCDEADDIMRAALAAHDALTAEPLVGD